MTTAMNAVCDQIECMVREHEVADHEGEKCPLQRMQAAAFVAKRLGFTTHGGQLDALTQLGASFISVFLEVERSNEAG
jgi:hypothetical protein